MFAKLGVPALLLVVVLSVAQTTFARIWTDRQGQTVNGQFLRIRDGKVVVLSGSKPVYVPFHTLSDADQEYVREKLKAKGQEHLIPSDPELSSLTGDPGRELLDGSDDEEPGPARTWTDRRGRKITARFVRFDGTRVVMLKDEKEVSVPLTQLSAEDRRYVMEQHAGQQRRKAMARRLAAGGQQLPGSSTASGGGHSAGPMGPAGKGLDTGMTGPSGPTTTFPPTTPSPPNIPGASSGWPPASTPPPTPAPPAIPAPPTMPSIPSPRPPASSRPTMSRPAEPVPSTPRSMPEFPTHSSRWMGEEGVCSNCNKAVPANIGAGDHCPHCGVYFEYEEDTFGNRRHAPRKNSWANSPGRIRGSARLIAFVVVIIISGLGALFRAIRG